MRDVTITPTQSTELRNRYCRYFFDTRQYIRTNTAGIQQSEYREIARAIKKIIAKNPKHPLVILPKQLFFIINSPFYRL